MKEKTIYLFIYLFILIKLLFLFIKVRCLINVYVSLEANLEGQGLHCLPYVGSNLGVEIFLKKREYQKRMR